MGQIKIAVEGSSEDIVRLHDHLQYHTRGITDIVWTQGTPVVDPICKAEFTTRV